MSHELIKNNLFNNNYPNSNYSQLLIGRVVDIILDDKHPEFKRLGEWNSLGTIFFNEANKITSGEIDLKLLPFARPLHSYKKYYPLKNELISITSFPNFDAQNNISLTTYYYDDIINIWNHPHHNALPLINNTDEKIDSEYSKVGKGNTSKQKSNSTTLNLGKKFVEQQNIKPLIPNEGDLIFESRFGSSIRFGANQTIIRNGQDPTLNDEGWIPNNENINNDLSSIYFSSTGSVDIKVASSNLKSHHVFASSKDNSKIINVENNIINNEVIPSNNINIAPYPSPYPTESIQLNQTSSFVRVVEDDFNISDETLSDDVGETTDILEDTFTAPISSTSSPLINNGPVVINFNSSGQSGLSNIGPWGIQIGNEVASMLGYKPTYNSIYRTKANNDSLAYSSPTSYHLTGNAIDINPKDWNNLSASQQTLLKNKYDYIFHNNHHHLEPGKQSILLNNGGGIKTSYTSLEFRKAQIIKYLPSQMVREIKSAIPDFSLDIQKAVYTVMKYENGGKTYNYNGWGIEMQNGIWQDPEKAITHQITLKEKATGALKSYAGFDNIRSAIRFTAYALKRKNISANDINIAEAYAKKWVGLSVSNVLFEQVVKEANTLFK